jgi:Fungal Zn(2)-Cys(6) binuclear cluster domain
LDSETRHVLSSSERVADYSCSPFDEKCAEQSDWVIIALYLGKSPAFSTMDATGLSFHGIRGNQVATGPKLLSCTSCRQRKIKCNKMHPCEPCQRSSLECVFPSRRVRAPRSKPRGLDTRDAELLRRIKRLERFMSNVDDGTTTSRTSAEPPTPDLSNPTTSAPTPFQPTDVSEQGTQSDVGLDSQYASFIKEQGSGTRRLRGYFWRSLGDEFDGLRQLLEHPVESDDEDGDETASASPESKMQSPLFILKEPDSIADLEASYPSDHHRTILYHFYLANVDPLCKILHRPTINAYLASSQELLDQSNRRFKFTSLEAISFAVYFAAVTSMTPQDCLTHLSKDKDVLLAQYKRNTETALAQADLLNTMEMVTLQAFTIYIVSIS